MVDESIPSEIAEQQAGRSAPTTLESLPSPLAGEKVLSGVSTLAGRLRFFYPIWQHFVKERIILEWIRGYKIQFNARVSQRVVPSEPNWFMNEKDQINRQIKKLMEKGVIEECDFVKNQFISKNFLRPKPDGSCRLILNLKELNKFLDTEHFKLEDIKTVKTLVHQGCFLASLDMKDAYYLIPIEKESRKFLRFIFMGKIYEFTCLHFGLNIAPYLFTKIMKPVINFLRKRGFLSVIYLGNRKFL